MRTMLLLIPMALLSAATNSDRPVDPAAAFQRLKTLAGEWEADSSMGKAHLTYEVIAAGTAVVERETMGDMSPMMTVYHLDGNRLMLTHYCIVGNQPRMQARRFDPATGELQFDFLDATNLSSPRAAHIHNGRIRFVDSNHFTGEWD